MPKVKIDTDPDSKYHPYWRDPDGKVILQSTDGIKFRASSFRLSKAR